MTAVQTGALPIYAEPADSIQQAPSLAGQCPQNLHPSRYRCPRGFDRRVWTSTTRHRQPGYRQEVVLRRSCGRPTLARRSEEHTSELQSLMRISYAVFCLKKKIQIYKHYHMLA